MNNVQRMTKSRMEVAQAHISILLNHVNFLRNKGLIEASTLSNTAYRIGAIFAELHNIEQDLQYDLLDADTKIGNGLKFLKEMWASEKL